LILCSLGLKQHLPCRCIQQSSFLEQIVIVQKLFILKLKPDINPEHEKLSEHVGQEPSKSGNHENRQNLKSLVNTGPGTQLIRKSRKQTELEKFKYANDKIEACTVCWLCYTG